MAKVPRSGLPFVRQLNSWVAAKQLKAQTVASMVATKMKAAAEAGSVIDIAVVEQKETFWMKDPKSGNWIPESHFGEIDVAELREKLLANARRKRLSNN